MISHFNVLTTLNLTHCEKRAISIVLSRQIFITIKTSHPSGTLGARVKDREELSGQQAACAVEKPKAVMSSALINHNAQGGSSVCRWEGDYSQRNTSWAAAAGRAFNW